MNCQKHPDVPIIVRSSGSVNGGQIRWGCAVCNSLKLDEVRDELRSMTRDRDYHFSAALQQSVYWKSYYLDRIEKLEDALHEICGNSTEQGVIATAEIALEIAK
jgi:hypothetical protein